MQYNKDKMNAFKLVCSICKSESFISLLMPSQWIYTEGVVELSEGEGIIDSIECLKCGNRIASY